MIDCSPIHGMRRGAQVRELLDAMMSFDFSKIQRYGIEKTVESAPAPESR